MSERALLGFAAAPGQAAGRAIRLDAVPAAHAGVVPEAEREAQLERARGALAAAAAEVQRIGERLRAEGRPGEAEIVETGVLMAGDPALDAAVAGLVLEAGRPAAAALQEAADGFADQLAAIPDRLLAERSEDVRSLGRRAAARASGSRRRRDEGVLVAAGLGPADVAELGPEVRGVALAAGGVTAHAAIVARSLGLPMVIGLGPAALEVREGERLVVDGDGGRLIRFPDPALTAAAERDRERRLRARAHAVARSQQPAETRDGVRLCILANAASAAEITEALAQGAEGVGLLRTELRFLDAAAWPTGEQHHRFLEPLLAQLSGRIATVRLLDFGGDKTPPFLAGSIQRGVELMLEAPEALRTQLAAILGAAGNARLRILIPMVTSVDQVLAVRQALDAVLAEHRPPALGAMIETPEAALHAGDLVRVLDFVSLGTNDLTQLVLGLDRERSGASPVTHPAVLRLVAAAMRAGRAAGIPVEVCGEAASDPATIPILVGLGADELSVGAARVGEVRELVRGLDAEACRELAERALLAEVADASGKRV